MSWNNKEEIPLGCLYFTVSWITVPCQLFANACLILVYSQLLRVLGDRV